MCHYPSTTVGVRETEKKGKKREGRGRESKGV
jgi:hypothetical protein